MSEGAVYLGSGGMVELQRPSSTLEIVGVLDPGDINTALRRFSAEAIDPDTLVTGDRLSIRREDFDPSGNRLNLELVDGHNAPDGTWYVHVDVAGGIRLYDTFTAALNAEPFTARELVVPTALQNISWRPEGSRRFRGIAGIRSYSLTTSRATVDITALGDRHLQMYEDGMISGQGQLLCNWSYETPWCSGYNGATEGLDTPHYLAMLVLRLKLGAKFAGRFYIKANDSALSGQRPESADDTLYWETDCIVTNVGFNLEPTSLVTTTIDFVTTGPISLKIGVPPSLLLQEDGGLILQEDGNAIGLDTVD